MAVIGDNKKKRRRNKGNANRGGVKTAKGKEISSMNALKHGILSKKLAGYDKINTEKLYLALVDEFNVTTAHQSLLVEQLVNCQIKLSRCSNFELEILKEKMATTNNPGHIPEDLFAATMIPDDAKVIIDEQVFKRMELVLTRYEPQLVNRMIKLINNLKQYQ